MKEYERGALTEIPSKQYSNESKKKIKKLTKIEFRA